MQIRPAGGARGGAAYRRVWGAGAPGGGVAFPGGGGGPPRWWGGGAGRVDLLRVEEWSLVDEEDGMLSTRLAAEGETTATPPDGRGDAANVRQSPYGVLPAEPGGQRPGVRQPEVVLIP